MQNNRLKILVNGFEFDFSPQDLESIYTMEGNSSETSVIYKNKTFKGNVEETSTRSFKTETNCRVYEVKIKNRLDQLVDNLGLSTAKSVKLTQIKAPMPGLVIQVDVEPGQKVEENDKILILEAMKMENVLRIPQAAMIKKILVKSGDAVEKGQVLVELE